MHTPFVALTFLAVSTMAQKLAFTNTASFGAMLKRGDAIIKRQGYTPDTTSCGTGDTCEEACGVGQVECPSSSAFTLYCHDSTDGSACCPDGSGNSCEAGYYCTSDSKGDTYCCPDGIDTANCAAQYSLTVSLIRQTAVITPSATPLESSLPAETPVSTSLLHVSSTTSVHTSAANPTTKASTTVTTSITSQFTGGAGKVVGAGAAVVVGAMGFAGLL